MFIFNVKFIKFTTAELFVEFSINYYFPVITASAQYSKEELQHKEGKSVTSEIDYSMPALHIKILLQWALQETEEIDVWCNPVRYSLRHWKLFVNIMRIILLCCK